VSSTPCSQERHRWFYTIVASTSGIFFFWYFGACKAMVPLFCVPALLLMVNKNRPKNIDIKFNADKI